MKYKIKFFGSKNKKEQIKLIRMDIDAPNRNSVRQILIDFGYVVINGLKIREWKSMHFSLSYLSR